MNIEMKILDARLTEWGLPKFQSEKAAAIDLYACVPEGTLIRPGQAAVLISAGFAMHMHDAQVAAVIAPRSSTGHKKGLVLGNTVGIIDADYTGEVFISAWNRNGSGEAIVIEPGDRIAQLLFIPVLRPTFETVIEFTEESQRGAGGFGSTGT